MKFYCGIDLSARECHVRMVDEQLKTIVEQNLPNELTSPRRAFPAFPILIS